MTKRPHVALAREGASLDGHRSGLLHSSIGKRSGVTPSAGTGCPGHVGPKPMPGLRAERVCNLDDGVADPAGQVRDVEAARPWPPGSSLEEPARSRPFLGGGDGSGADRAVPVGWVEGVTPGAVAGPFRQVGPFSSAATTALNWPPSHPAGTTARAEVVGPMLAHAPDPSMTHQPTDEPHKSPPHAQCWTLLRPPPLRAQDDSCYSTSRSACRSAKVASTRCQQHPSPRRA